MINVNCDRCGKELEEPGALSFGTPITIPGYPGMYCRKFHICVDCTDNNHNEPSATEHSFACMAAIGSDEMQLLAKAIHANDYIISSPRGYVASFDVGGKPVYTPERVKACFVSMETAKIYLDCGGDFMMEKYYG